MILDSIANLPLTRIFPHAGYMVKASFLSPDIDFLMTRATRSAADWASRLEKAGLYGVDLPHGTALIRRVLWRRGEQLRAP